MKWIQWNECPFTYLLLRNEAERDVYRRIDTWMKLPEADRLKKFKRIAKTEKRLNFVKQRFPPPAVQSEISYQSECTSYAQPIDGALENECFPTLVNASVYGESEGTN